MSDVLRTAKQDVVRLSASTTLSASASASASRFVRGGVGSFVSSHASAVLSIDRSLSWKPCKSITLICLPPTGITEIPAQGDRRILGPLAQAGPLNAWPFRSVGYKGFVIRESTN
jgi:hypothetical protein